MPAQKRKRSSLKPSAVRSRKPRAKARAKAAKAKARAKTRLEKMLETRPERERKVATVNECSPLST